MTQQKRRAKEKAGIVKYGKTTGLINCEDNSILKVEEEIAALKSTLNYLIDKGIGFDTLQELSLRIDKLIVEYYRMKQGNG